MLPLSPACARATPPVVLATTTSVVNARLLDEIVPVFLEQTGQRVRTLQVGSGLALSLLARNEADVVISHAPAAEAAALTAHPAWWYRKILYNDFLIVGPTADPARVGDAIDAVDAMQRIARSQTVFLSRGDESGTHEREQQLWQLAGATPAEGHLVIAGAGMGQTLRIASTTGAYTLTDRGTFVALAQSVQLKVLSSGDPRLLNTYAVVADPANPGGIQFAKWLAEGAGRQRLAAVTQTGKVLGFTIWPVDQPADRPDARPY